MPCSASLLPAENYDSVYVLATVHAMVVDADRQSRWGLGDATAGFVVGVASTTLFLGLFFAVTGRTSGLAATAIGMAGLWVGFLGVPVYAARTKGSGSLAAEFGLRTRWQDAVWGLPLGVACQVIMVPLVYFPLRPFIDDDELSRPADELLGDFRGLGLILLVLLVVAAAPVIEELFFRGLLLRALTHRFGPIPGILGSAVVFGATHFQLLQFVALAAFGVVLAALSVRHGRLGPAIWAHVGFNATTVLILVATR